MNRKLKDALSQQKQQTEQYNQKLYGMLGVTIGGQRRVEVPNRNSYVYVRLRNSQSELIQAFNNRVAPSYNLPVVLERQGNRYVILDVDTTRYDNNWSSYSPYLARHGNTHSFDPETGGGGDVVWVHPRQFMPLLAFPSGSIGSPHAVISPYTLKKEDGTWRYVGNTGTASFTPYNPPNSGTAIMGLIALNTNSGNPYLLINSGTSFLDTITGTSQIYPYIPTLTNPSDIPIAAVRLVSGTSRLTWDNIYDVRQFVHNQPSGSSAGISSVAVQDEGVPQGNVTTLNFVGDGVTATVSGSVARVSVSTSTGSSSSFTGDPGSAVLTNASGTLFTPTWLKWGTSSQPFLEFGADVAGKESNAGKMGYGSFGNIYTFYIIGAGTGSNRLVRIDDDLTVGDTVEARFFNINDPAATYNITGSPHRHSHLDLSNIGVNTHTGIDSHIANTSNPHNTTAAQVQAMDYLGWIPADVTWTRTGNHTFTISGDVTLTYRKGVKVVYQDGGALEYGVIGSSSHSGGTTTVNLIPNTDYAMAAATITNNFYSLVENPYGFPHWFNYTPTLTGFSADPGSAVYRWRVTGNACEVMVRQGSNGTSNATTFTISIPVIAATITNAAWNSPGGAAVDNGVNQTIPGLLQVLSAATSMNVFKDWAGTAWTNSGGKRIGAGLAKYEF